MTGVKTLDHGDNVSNLTTPTASEAATTDTESSNSSPASVVAAAATAAPQQRGKANDVLRWIKGLRFKFRDEKARSYAKVRSRHGSVLASNSLY